jgi:hypothetical protein
MLCELGVRLILTLDWFLERWTGRRGGTERLFRVWLGEEGVEDEAVGGGVARSPSLSRDRVRENISTDCFLSSM